MTSPIPSPPPGYVVRPPVMEDLLATTELLNVVEQADEGLVDTTPDVLREEWEAPGSELALDAWVVFEERPTASGSQSMPVGFGRIEPRDQHRRLLAWAAVHPAHRGRGLGWYLTDRIEARAAEHAALAPPGKPVLLQQGVVGDRAAHRLLEERGYALVRHFWQMEAPLSAELPPPRVPDGARLRTFVLGQDDRAVHRAIQESFAEHWAFAPRGFDEWAEHRLHEHGFDPDLWWVVEEEGEVVGALCGKILDDVGWVDTLGVRRAWRKRGIGEALLRHSFLEFQRRGVESVKLGVDAANETGATALYERVGMHSARQFDVFEKRLR